MYPHTSNFIIGTALFSTDIHIIEKSRAFIKTSDEIIKQRLFADDSRPDAEFTQSFNIRIYSHHYLGRGNAGEIARDEIVQRSRQLIRSVPATPLALAQEFILEYYTITVEKDNYEGFAVLCIDTHNKSAKGKN